MVGMGMGMGMGIRMAIAIAMSTRIHTRMVTGIITIMVIRMTQRTVMPHMCTAPVVRTITDAKRLTHDRRRIYPCITATHLARVTRVAHRWFFVFRRFRGGD